MRIERRHRRALGAALALALALGAGAAAAQGADGAAPLEPDVPVPAAPAASPEADRGPVTGLPMPRFVSLKTSRANVRRGPGLTHRVDWVFVRRDMPLQVVAEYGHWRRVRDVDAATGWVHYSLIQGDRTALVTAETADFRAAPDETAAVTARAERGVVVQVEACAARWCRVSRGRAQGWAAKADLWGVGRDETFD